MAAYQYGLKTILYLFENPKPKFEYCNMPHQDIIGSGNVALWHHSIVHTNIDPISLCFYVPFLAGFISPGFPVAF